MRIGIMLRAYERAGGVGIYARNIVRHLLDLDQENEYVLLYYDRKHLGAYADRPNVEEVALPPCNQFLWDQWHVAREIRARKIDLIFNTKFSVPLFTKAKRVMVLHGASWFAHPELYKKLDILYVRAAMPVYCRKSDFLISNSDLTTHDFIRFLKVPTDKIETVRLAAGDHFKAIDNGDLLDKVRAKYGLPERFILTVTSYDPRKNMESLVSAFEETRKQEHVHLVIIGKDCQKYADDCRLKERGLEGVVHFPGWVEQEDLPAIYNLASTFGFPSVYEEFGIPVVEAMACGCPIVSSNTGAIPELTQGAALLNDPFDVLALSESFLQILQSPAKAAVCRSKGLERAKAFSWQAAATRTLEILNTVAST